MNLHNIESTEVFTFDNLEDLRDFLNRFKSTELDEVYPANGKDYFKVYWETEILSDGSKVNNCQIDTL
jgi:hypothetical protein